MSTPRSTSREHHRTTVAMSSSSATTAAASRPSAPSRSSYSQNPPSAGQRPLSGPSTTPHSLPVRSPFSAGQPLPPSSSLNAQMAPPNQDPRSPSPNYFGFVNQRSQTQTFDSNAAGHAKRNWDAIKSNARSTAAQSPSVPVEANPEFDAFRKRAETNSFTLGHGNLEFFSKQQRNSPDSTSSVASSAKKARSSRSPEPSSPLKEAQKEEPKGARPSIGTHQAHSKDSGSFFDIPRYESPAQMGGMANPSAPPRAPLNLSDRHPRLSLPADRASPPLPSHALASQNRAETLPAVVHDGNPRMLAPEEAAQLIRALPEQVLLLDLRVFPQFSASRIKTAINLCLPTTLLKRQTYNIQKLEDTLAKPAEKERFRHWASYKYIVVYDANSSQMRDAVSSVHTLKKFEREGWKGQPCIIRGGFAAFSKDQEDLVDRQSSNTATSMGSGLSLAPAGQGTQVAGGCPMPETDNAANPFFGNIRQNTDLIGGVGQEPIKRPATMTKEMETSIPHWLLQASQVQDKGKMVSDRFLKIEKDEKQRMQDALSTKVQYQGVPTEAETTAKIKIAGIEKGSKNRYNNIFPYDHSRVKLQGVPSHGCDYVNGNHVKADLSNKHYIATQAPTRATFEVRISQPYKLRVSADRSLGFLACSVGARCTCSCDAYCRDRRRFTEERSILAHRQLWPAQGKCLCRRACATRRSCDVCTEEFLEPSVSWSAPINKPTHNSGQSRLSRRGEESTASDSLCHDPQVYSRTHWAAVPASA